MTDELENALPREAAAKDRPEPDARDDRIRALACAFEQFTETTKMMEESYRRLEARVQALDQELAEKNRALAYTSDYLCSVLESMSDGVIAVDTAGMLTTFNSAASQVLGYSGEEVLGEAFDAVFGREFDAGQGGSVMTLRAKSGRLVSVAERDSPLFDRMERRIGTVKVFQDLTEVEALRERIRQQDRLAAIGEMAATVAHEIRNPLGGIRGFAALLGRELADDESRRRLVEKIEVGAKDLERVVNELLEYTRPMELRLRSAHLRDVADAAIGFVKLEGKAITIRNEVPQALRCMFDPDRLRQVFLNMLLNAVQSIDKSGDVVISAREDAGEITISLSDTGMGMAPAQVEQVFAPFYTTREKGTGLGLAVASRIVEGHGGRVEVDSVLGQGSTFRVVLPAGAAGHEEPGRAPADAT